MIVHVADIIVNTCKVDSGCRLSYSKIYPEAAEIMARQLETVSDWFPEVVAEIESSCEFLLKDEDKSGGVSDWNCEARYSRMEI